VALDIVTPMPAWRPSDTCLFGLGPIAPITMGAGGGRWAMGNVRLDEAGWAG